MKATLIKRFDGSARLIYPKPDTQLAEMDFVTVESAEEFIFQESIDIGFVHGQGSASLGKKIAADFEQRDDTEKFATERY